MNAASAAASSESTAFHGSAQEASTAKASGTGAASSSSSELKTGSADATVQAVHPGTVITAVQTVEPVGLMREAAAQRTLDGQSSSQGSSGSANSAASSGQSTFTSLDSSSAGPATTWIHAGAQHAEAGYQDPTLGWVGVRAEMSGGTVHASVVPSSAAAADALGQHLGGLNSYLSEHSTPVSSLSMASPGSDQQLGSSSGQNNGAEAGQQQSSGQKSIDSASSAVQAQGSSNDLSSEYEPLLREGSHISLVA
jgi:hypothetical protein